MTLQDALFDFEKKLGNEYNIFKGNLLSDAVKSQLSTDFNAFLFGLISDQSTKAEIAWSLPWNLKERLGHFDMRRIADMPVTDLENILKTKPALHRYPGNIAKYLHRAANMILNNYDGMAANIWTGQTATETIKRLEDFSGISHKKAALGTYLLVRDFDVDFPDKDAINIAYDVHIRRIFLNAGFVETDTLPNVTAAAQEIYPEFPGRLTNIFWALGRDICRPTWPLCPQCPIRDFCKKNKTETPTTLF
ncbi:endonuclease III [bacterium]|nr:endonuclease III [bacterium]